MQLSGVPKEMNGIGLDDDEDIVGIQETDKRVGDYKITFDNIIRAMMTRWVK